MNSSMKEVVKVLLVIAILAGGAFCASSDVWGQDKGASLAKQIQGTWILVSIVNEKDGKKTEPFGPNPKGLIIYTPDGHFSYIYVRPDLPKFAANDRTKGTDKENRAVIQGTNAGFGTYTVNDKEHAVIEHHEGSTFPNFTGQDHKRILTVTGDELKRTVPTTPIGGTNYMIFKRAK